MIASSVIHDTLKKYGDITDTALSQYLTPREPVEYLYELMQDYPARKGRMFRATLCIATAVELGAEVEAALPAAMAIELLHNAFLIHDDIEDDSDTRRGFNSLHKIHGVPLAINAGDGLSNLAIEALISSSNHLPAESVIELVQRAQRTIRTTIEGQAMELGWRQNNAENVTIADCLTMIIKKTCCYTTLFPLQAGTMIAGRKDIPLEDLIPFATMLGCAFQIQDDILNLAGDEKKYGKELNGDLFEGKRTLMLIHAIGSLSATEKRKVMGILRKSRDDKDVAEIEWILSLMEKHGSIDFARMYANRLAGAAEHEGKRLFGNLPETDGREFLLGLSRWVIERT